MFCCCQDAGGVQCLESISVFLRMCLPICLPRWLVAKRSLPHALVKATQVKSFGESKARRYYGSTKVSRQRHAAKKTMVCLKACSGIPALRHLQLQQQNRVTAQAKRTFSLLSHTPANRNECPCCKPFLTTPANTSILSLSLKNQNFKFVTLTRVPSQPVALCFPISYLLNLNAVLTAGDSSRPSPDGSSDGPKAFANGFRLVWVSPSYRLHAA